MSEIKEFGRELLFIDLLDGQWWLGSRAKQRTWLYTFSKRNNTWAYLCSFTDFQSSRVVYLHPITGVQVSYYYMTYNDDYPSNDD